MYIIKILRWDFCHFLMYSFVWLLMAVIVKIKICANICASQTACFVAVLFSIIIVFDLY